VKRGGRCGIFLLPFDEVGLVILYEHEPDRNDKYTTRVEAGRIGILTGTAGAQATERGMVGR
jgi:hypothetical protein